MTAPRIVLDATGLGSGAGGDETMLTAILDGLALTAEPDDDLYVVAAAHARLPEAIEGHPSFTVVRVRRFPGVVHFPVVLPWIVFRSRPKPALVFSAIHAPMNRSVPLALMVQDLSFEHHPEYFPRSTRFRLQTFVRRQARRAHVVLTLSDDSRRDLIETYRLPPDRVFRIPLAGIEPVTPTSAEREETRSWLRDQGVDGPFFLYLGNLHPRKNIGRAIEAFGRLRASRPDLSDHRFVIAGGRWWGSGEQQSAMAAAPAGSVVFLGRVDDVQREVLLRDALALVYVSLFEGFGLPPLEAMARGTPVVASNLTSIPEVVGDGGLLVDPLDIGAISAAMERVATDPDLRSSLVERGLARAAAFRPRATGEAVRAAFKAAISSSVGA